MESYPAPTTLGALTLALPGPPICGKLVGPALCEPMTAEDGKPVGTAHLVSAKTTKSTTISLATLAS